MMPKIPLDVVVLIAEKCIKKDFRSALKFASCCKKLYNKPYIKEEYLKAKRTLVKNFIERIWFWSTQNEHISIIFNVNGIEQKIDRYKEHGEEWFKNGQSREFHQNFLSDKIFHIFWRSQWGSKNEDWHGIALNSSIDNFDTPFIHISTGISEGNTEYKPLKHFSWTGLTKINIEF